MNSVTCFGVSGNNNVIRFSFEVLDFVPVVREKMGHGYTMEVKELWTCYIHLGNCKLLEVKYLLWACNNLLRNTLRTTLYYQPLVIVTYFVCLLSYKYLFKSECGTLQSCSKSNLNVTLQPISYDINVIFWQSSNHSGLFLANPNINRHMCICASACYQVYLYTPLKS